MVRQFRLINAEDEVLNLNSLDTFGHQPQGLGLKMSNSYIPYEGNFIPTEVEPMMNQIEVSLVVGAKSETEPYEAYYELMEFFESAPYTLEYETPAGIFYRIVQLSEVTKSDMNAYSIFEEHLVLDCITPWFEEYEYTPDDIIVIPDGSGKIYELMDDPIPDASTGYTFSYIYGQHASGAGTVVNVKNGVLKWGMSAGAHCKVEMQVMSGTMYNPRWSLYNNSQIVQSDGFSLSVAVGYTLEVSNYPEEQRAVLVSSHGVETDVSQQQDLTRTNFIRIPQGEYPIVFTYDGDAEVSIRVTVREEKLVI